MIIKELRLINHRNYDDEFIEFHDNTNILVGKNAQGKTNLLEAIYIAARGYSFKSIKESELINFDKNEMYLKAVILSKNKRKNGEIKISKNYKKQIKINDVDVNVSEMKSQFGVVLFAPEEILIIKETPSLRRKFIDDIISNNDIAYKIYLNNYNNTRRQKNLLLKNPAKNKYFEQMLTSYNTKLVEYGAKIGIYRYKYLDILKKYAKEFHKELTSDKEDLDIIYEYNFAEKLDDLTNIEKQYHDILLDKKQSEIERYQSLYGPHKDEIIFLINGKDVKNYASQGQQRTVMLSLKLAEAKLIEVLTSTKPILLWDDVFSELDNSRASLLVQKSKKYQNIITTNSLVNLDLDNSDSKVFTIHKGKVILGREKDGTK